ncbi:MAG: hypothetical protein RMN25_14660, partial [Anaerolineae bacterium]|nr:hypothetical protein [Thermoflexales bacterium]MDW8409013.1 hypothetical protein [Anaerolineae bacterium]
MSEKLEKVKTEVAKQMAEMDVAESAMEKQMAELAVIHARIDELQRAMMKFQDMLQDALANADLCNLNSIFKVVKLAKALATLLDVKVLDLSSSIPQVEVA